MLEEPPVNDRVHVEVVSASTRIGLLHPKVHMLHFLLFVYLKAKGGTRSGAICISLETCDYLFEYAVEVHCSQY